MTTWTPIELGAIGDADELKIASFRDDGSLRPYVIIWTVRAGDDIYVRSAYGKDNGWFTRALASGTGRVSAGGIEKDVSFELLRASENQAAIDAAYHDKYDRYGARIVNSVVGEQVRDVTIKVTPRD